MRWIRVARVGEWVIVYATLNDGREVEIIREHWQGCFDHSVNVNRVLEM